MNAGASAEGHPDPQARALLGRLRAFGLPGGAEAARGVCGVRLTLRGELRASPRARWVPFTAEETLDATRSGFRWDARLHTGAATTATVTDMYRDGRGWAGARAGDTAPVVEGGGPDFDRGELQRYLGELVLCPPALVAHPSLDWLAVGPGTLRVWDRAAAGGAAVDLELDAAGRPLACRADRPHLLGTRLIPTPWSGTYAEPRVWEGLRVPTRLNGAWHLPAGPFLYVREEIVALVALR